LGFVTDDLRGWRRLQAVALKRRGWVQRDLAEGSDPGLPLARAGGVWLSGPGVDPGAHRPGQPGGVRRPRPPGARQPIAGRPGLDPADAGPAGQPAGRVGHRVVAGRYVARGAEAGRARAADPGSRGRGRVLPAAGGSPDIRPPDGRTPVLRGKVTRDHRSILGGLMPTGKVYTRVRQEPLTGLDTVEFLAHLLRVAGDRLLVVWDGSPIHRRAAVTEFVAARRGRCGWRRCPGTPRT
jgi:hypothetical protein